MTSDVNQVQTGVNMTLRLLLRSPAVIIGAVIVSFTISKEVGLVFLCTVPTLFLVVFLIMYFSIPFFNKSQEKLDRVVELTRENLVGVRVIRAFNKQKQEIKTYQKENKRHFHEFGNNLVRKSINVLFNTKLKDIMTGYRVFNKVFVKNMPVMSPKFDYML